MVGERSVKAIASVLPGVVGPAPEALAAGLSVEA